MVGGFFVHRFRSVPSAFEKSPSCKTLYACQVFFRLGNGVS
ncbi:hypothetical protein BSU04_10895 [Caballeronia sordidicola]|uniref:Uncharacterized protein n=1 Tax=Caballeronia sordidicola TaxID=196367 RepID=A0A226X653_CABSO|nr:hypothetical protein BSU04_10895 [Caballeronia sordidicola]